MYLKEVLASWNFQMLSYKCYDNYYLKLKLQFICFFLQSDRRFFAICLLSRCVCARTCVHVHCAADMSSTNKSLLFCKCACVRACLPAPARACMLVPACVRACCPKVKTTAALWRSVIRIRGRLECSRKHMLMLHDVVMASRCQQ